MPMPRSLAFLSVSSVFGMFVAVLRLTAPPSVSGMAEPIYVSIMSMVVPGSSVLLPVFGMSVPMPRLSTPLSISGVFESVSETLALLSMSNVSMPILGLSASLSPSTLPVPGPASSPSPFLRWSFPQTPMPVSERQKLG